MAEVGWRAATAARLHGLRFADRPERAGPSLCRPEQWRRVALGRLRRRMAEAAVQSHRFSPRDDRTCLRMPVSSRVRAASSWVGNFIAWIAALVIAYQSIYCQVANNNSSKENKR